ncbi:MAG: redoxin domain-containing protein, partial [Bacillota bacterium]
MMKEYEKAPTFTAKNEKGQEVNSDKYSGKYIVLYFYPKAFTPGCTKECNAFSENIEEFISFKMDDLSKVDFKDMETPQVKIVGISPDKPEKLADFKEKYNLKIELLSDTDKEIAEGFASLKENGTSILRSTFIIDPWGRIRKTWYGVKVKGHVEEVLEELKSTISEDMDINHQIKERRARRCFDENRTVSRGTIKQLIEAAHLAPSC